MKRWQQISLAASLALGLGLGGGALYAKRAMLRKVESVAARYHAKVTVGGAHVGLLSGRLENVHITLDDVPGFAVDANVVDVTTSLSLHPERVVVNGGRVEVADLDALRTYWSHRETAPPSDGARPSTEFSAEGLAFHVAVSDLASLPDLASLSGEGLALSKSANGLVLRTKTLTATKGAWTVDATGLAIEASQRLELRSLNVDTVKVQSEGAVGAPPPTSPAASTSSEDDQDLRARAAAIEARLRAGTRALCTLLPAAVMLSANHLSFEKKGGINVGQGPFSLAKQDDAMVATFASDTREGTTPLKLRVVSPCKAEDDVVVHLEGGPVPLSLIGLREGALGLVDVDKATVLGEGDLRLAQHAVSVDATATLDHVGVHEPKLAKDPIRDLRLSTVVRAVVTDGRTFRIDDLDVGVGAAHFHMRGTAEAREVEPAKASANANAKPTAGTNPNKLAAWSANFNVDVPSVGCDDMLASVPLALRPTLEGAKMAGTFGARGVIAFDGQKLDDMTLDYQIRNDCRMTSVPPALDRHRFDGRFQHIVYHADGTKGEETTGPGTEAWTAFEDISPFMQAAVLTTEDGGFRHHHGFSTVAIKRALINNLKAGKFLQGASTISMQLAKNLFLSREKTLSRKLEEIVLTDYLEQTFDKDTMMELYLNIIEFGPNIYGIARAAEHYFGRTPAELNLPECMFLATLLPSPLKLSHLANQAEISPGWQAHIERLMKIAHKTGKVTAGELSEGLSAAHIQFRRPGSPRPPRRAPVQGGRVDGEGAEWVPVEAP